ncbi:hypothetical protein HF521_016902 [Silurus meridionalis]|uniref:Uncharacterized protein n=1 Tax=Silurus meridionalis TaxID=175797 RepID=A0A8T0BLP1_SILME|nr:hypothetical protein HF521_016902 [Silurus meridionalis]
MNMPEEVPVHDLVPEVSDQFPGLSHQELLSPKDICFDPPLFPSVSESTFCQTNTCYGSDCTSSEVQLEDEEEITLLNNDIFSMLNEDCDFLTSLETRIILKTPTTAQRSWILYQSLTLTASRIC